MPVNVAIVGPAGSGKTTLFNALTAGRGADGVGMVDVPDERLARLTEAVKPAKTTAAQVRVEDTPPGSRAQRVAFARQADVLVKVARCFGPDPDPAIEMEEFALDLVLADLASVEKRIDVVAKEARAGKKDAQAETDVLQAAKAHLDAGKQLRTLALEAEQRAMHRLGVLLGKQPADLRVVRGQPDLGEEHDLRIGGAVEEVEERHHRRDHPQHRVLEDVAKTVDDVAQDVGGARRRRRVEAGPDQRQRDG